jgi:hypothetical protein
MLLGVATILGMVAVVSAVARSSLAHVFENHGTAIASVSRVMDALAGAALTSIALFELSR